MTNSQHTPGIQPERLDPQAYLENFTDLHPPLSEHEAAVESDRCYFCHDAPCIEACPTGIDIPLFIRQIAAGSEKAAAVTIFDSNILGGMCARVCPTETLCEEACVRETSESKPVAIGRLQRFATDAVMADGTHPYSRAEPTGKAIAVVGAGPAGLSCAHRLAMKGHDVSVFDSRPKPGGLNEYGIAAYKTVDGFAEKEVNWLLAIGGISLHLGVGPVDSPRLHELLTEFDAVFLGFGLAGVNRLSVEGTGQASIQNAVDFIADVRQASDLSGIPVGRQVLVLGGGMTAIDAAVQSKLLGANSVTIAYRGARSRMSASGYEQNLAATRGVRIMTDARPVRVAEDYDMKIVEFERTKTTDEGISGTGETFSIAADQVLVAVGQRLQEEFCLPDLENGKIKTSGSGRTSVDGLWAGGDCASGGNDLTVTAVAEGRDAAEDIHRYLNGC